jgi:hypothetical protein
MVLFNIYYLNDKKMKIKITEDQFKRLVENKINGKPINEGVFDILGKIAKYALGGAAISFILKKIMDKFRGKEPTKAEVEKEIEKVGSEISKEDKESSKIENKNIIIGDSLCPWIEKKCKASMIPGSEGERTLHQGGVTVQWLKRAVKSYPDVDKTIKSVIISIGTNDIYKDYGVSDLVDNLKEKFPNAKLMVVQGTYGDKIPCSSKGYCMLKETKQSTVDDYYDLFRDEGVKVIEPPVGNVKDAHGPLPIYEKIGESINSKL